MVNPSDTRPTATAALSLAALGVVFGDIGTSPLYAFREALAGEHEIAVVEANVLGVLSVMFWALVIVISIKYLGLVMRADNHGEGGILALVALLTGPETTRRRLVLLGLFGTALLYGDGMITPAISVLAAVEGIQVTTPAVHDWITPIVAAILVSLFAIQRLGTHIVGRFFGPVMVVWFTTLAALGIAETAREPSVMRALDPRWAIDFFTDNGTTGFLILGSIFLVVTGGEALYADMGHFGRRPIQLAWFSLVLPALLLNYLGQGALLLNSPEAVENPFYELAPSWAQWPLTVLATTATVIASQALITGAFSLTVQAINLGYLPRMRIIQTSASNQGQVYVPAVNWLLLLACLALVTGFGTSSRLAAAYGVAVTLTMTITTLLIASIARSRWNWSTIATVCVITPLLLIDLAFASANLFKIPSGGWFPLAVGLVGFAIFTTWQQGHQVTGRRLHRPDLTIAAFVDSLAAHPPARHEGTAVYLHRTPNQVPPALLTNLRSHDALHDTIAIVNVITADRPHVHPAERDRLTRHLLGFYELEMTYGFTDTINLDTDLRNLVEHDLSFDPTCTVYFLTHEHLHPTDHPSMARWRERLYTLMHRNALNPTAYFALPANRTIDIGTHVSF